MHGLTHLSLPATIYTRYTPVDLGPDSLERWVRLAHRQRIRGALSPLTSSDIPASWMTGFRAQHHPYVCKSLV